MLFWVVWITSNLRIAVGTALAIAAVAYLAWVLGLRVAIGVAISAGLLAYLLWTVDLGQLADQIRRTHLGWLLATVALAPLGLLARARRWRYLFPPRTDPPGLVPAMMIGYMANNVLPLRAGEFVRVYVVARRWRHGFWTALATLVVERVLDSLALVLILAVLVLLIPVPRMLEWAAAVVLVIDLVGVAVLTFLARFPDAGRRLITGLGGRWPHLARRLARVYDTFVRGLDGIRTPAHLLPLLAWTVIIWIIPAAAAWTTFRALDLSLPWVAGWTVLAFVGLGVSIPSAPGYVGVFHAASVLATGLFGVPPAAGLGYAIVFHATQYVPITLLGWIYLVREGMSLGEAARASSEATSTAPSGASPAEGAGDARARTEP